MIENDKRKQTELAANGLKLVKRFSLSEFGCFHLRTFLLNIFNGVSELEKNQKEEN